MNHAPSNRPPLPVRRRTAADDAGGAILLTSGRAADMAKVVFHADFADPRRFSALLTSVNNMVTYYQNELIDYDVRIVFVAHGIRFVTDDKLNGTPFQEDADMAERRESNSGRSAHCTACRA